MKHPIGVLVMAYGGPDALEDIPGYLADIRTGRPTTPEVLAEITNNYRLIGGRSPLLEYSLRQIEAVAANFDPTEFKFYLGMRHWTPWTPTLSLSLKQPRRLQPGRSTNPRRWLNRHPLRLTPTCREPDWLPGLQSRRHPASHSRRRPPAPLNLRKWTSLTSPAAVSG